jgi:hypothetical protein
VERGPIKVRVVVPVLVRGLVPERVQAQALEMEVRKALNQVPDPVPLKFRPQVPKEEVEQVRVETVNRKRLPLQGPLPRQVLMMLPGPAEVVQGPCYCINWK